MELGLNWVVGVGGPGWLQLRVRILTIIIIRYRSFICPLFLIWNYHLGGKAQGILCLGALKIGSRYLESRSGNLSRRYI